MAPHKAPRLLDRALRLLIQKPDLLRADLPGVITVVAFVAFGISNPTSVVRVAFGALGAISLLSLVGAIVLTRVIPRAPIEWYSGRFQRSVHDNHISVLLTAATSDRLDTYLRQEYPDWHLAELVSELWRASHDEGT